MLTKEPNMLRPDSRCVLRAFNTAKCDCGRGSHPDPAKKAYSVPQNPWGRYRLSRVGLPRILVGWATMHLALPVIGLYIR